MDGPGPPVVGGGNTMRLGTGDADAAALADGSAEPAGVCPGSAVGDGSGDPDGPAVALPVGATLGCTGPGPASREPRPTRTRMASTASAASPMIVLVEMRFMTRRV